jgi:hypothetical protein
LNALWDAEHAGEPIVSVSDLLDTIGARDLPDHQIERLVRDLKKDGLITAFGPSGRLDVDIRLTTEGRYEVEQWLAEPDKPTEHIPVPASQVFHIGTMNVTGPVLQGSTATNVTTSYGVSGDTLIKLVAQFRELLSAAELSPDDREALDADLEVIEEEAANPQPRAKWLRPALQRLRGALTTGALKGAEVGARQEVIHLIEQAQQALPG